MAVHLRNPPICPELQIYSQHHCTHSITFSLTSLLLTPCASHPGLCTYVRGRWWPEERRSTDITLQNPQSIWWVANPMHIVICVTRLAAHWALPSLPREHSLTRRGWGWHGCTSTHRTLQVATVLWNATVGSRLGGEAAVGTGTEPAHVPQADLELCGDGGA
jgi:hypothetical protein